jgi:hypothetical protein
MFPLLVRAIPNRGKVWHRQWSILHHDRGTNVFDAIVVACYAMAVGGTTATGRITGGEGAAAAASAAISAFFSSVVRRYNCVQCRKKVASWIDGIIDGDCWGFIVICFVDVIININVFT